MGREVPVSVIADGRSCDVAPGSSAPADGQSATSPRHHATPEPALPDRRRGLSCVWPPPHPSGHGAGRGATPPGGRGEPERRRSSRARSRPG
jgi:hypothetical protein